jgi:hypothetical protein
LAQDQTAELAAMPSSNPAVNDHPEERRAPELPVTAAATGAAFTGTGSLLDEADGASEAFETTVSINFCSGDAGGFGSGDWDVMESFATNCRAGPDSPSVTF